MDKDNSQESMISSNSLSFGKNRGEAYYSSNPTFYVASTVSSLVSTKGKSACYC